MKPVREVLPNGLVALVVEHHDVETVAVSVQAQAGSRFDPPERDGLAQMTAALLREGTVRHAKEEISESFDFLGADMGTGAGRYTAAVSARLLARDLEALFPMIAEMAREPVFPEHSIEIRRGETLTAIAESESDPRMMSSVALRRLLFPDRHPLGRRGFGTRESVSAIRREDLAAFHASHFGPERSSLVLVGDVETARALELIREQFGSWRPSNGPPPAMPPSPELEETRLDAKEIPGTFQVELSLGFPGIARSDPEFYAFELVNHVLGEFGMGGRLGARVREEHGFAYSIHSSFDAGLGAGPFAVRAGVDPEHVKSAVEDILGELRRMRDEGPRADEVERSRRALIRGFPLRLETQAGIAGYLQLVEMFGLGLDYSERYAGLLESVTASDLRRVAAKRLTPEKYALAVAGPVGRAEMP
jgi:zinc protease